MRHAPLAKFIRSYAPEVRTRYINAAQRLGAYHLGPFGQMYITVGDLERIQQVVAAQEHEDDDTT